MQRMTPLPAMGAGMMMRGGRIERQRKRESAMKLSDVNGCLCHARARQGNQLTPVTSAMSQRPSPHHRTHIAPIINGFEWA